MGRKGSEFQVSSGRLTGLNFAEVIVQSLTLKYRQVYNATENPGYSHHQVWDVRFNKAGWGDFLVVSSWE
jgi:hypothetical protein